MFTKPLQRLFSSCLAIAAIMIVISCNPDEDETGTPGGSGNTATLSTLPVSNITDNTAVTGGSITSDGGAAVTQRGVVWSTTPNPTLAHNSTNDGSGVGSFTSSLSGLTSGTTYFVRAYAINNAGTAYGNEVSFVTAGNSGETSEWLNPNLNYGSVTDQDGNTYATIQIGTQEWMAENLRTTTYANGDPIPNVINGWQWVNLSSGAWAHFNNDSQYEIPYGKLYNWYAVADPRNVCPTGWRVPSEVEWLNLINYLDPNLINYLDPNWMGFITTPNTAGGKMKSSGIEHWQSPNADASNESGFSGLPGGRRDGGDSVMSGEFTGVGNTGAWWSGSGLFVFDLNYDSGSVSMDGNQETEGFSVRCLRD